MTPPDKRRRKATVRKNIRLTPETIASVTAWCQANKISFSAGLETLVKTSLGQPMAEAMVPAVVSSVRRAILHQSNRLAKLWSYAAVEAGVAARLAGVAARLAIRKLVTEDIGCFLVNPDVTAEDIVFNTESDEVVGDELEALTLFKDVRAKARTRSARNVQRPIDLLMQHLRDGDLEDD